MVIATASRRDGHPGGTTIHERVRQRLAGQPKRNRRAGKIQGVASIEAVGGPARLIRSQPGGRDSTLRLMLIDRRSCVSLISSKIDWVDLSRRRSVPRPGAGAARFASRTDSPIGLEAPKASLSLKPACFGVDSVTQSRGIRPFEFAWRGDRGSSSYPGSGASV